MHELVFPLDEVLILAGHATAAPSTAPPLGDEPPGPALLLVAAEGICLLSNGFPQLDAAPGQAHAYGIRAVYADGYGPGTPTDAREAAIGVRGEFLIGTPVDEPVLRRLRAHAHTHDLFTFTLTATHTQLGVARSNPGCAAADLG
jgi:hypothetical protein